jgi:hypothetical protein
MMQKYHCFGQQTSCFSTSVPFFLLVQRVVGRFFISNDIWLVQNQFCYDQQHKQGDVPVLFGETKHQIQGILKVQVCRYPEKDHALSILSIEKYEELFFDQFRPNT